MRVLLTNQDGNKDIVEVIEVYFAEEDGSLEILCGENLFSYTIKANEDNINELKEAINILLIRGYVDLSAYESTYSEDDMDILNESKEAIDKLLEQEQEYDDSVYSEDNEDNEDYEEDTSQDDYRDNLYKALRSDDSEKKKGFFRRFIE